MGSAPNKTSMPGTKSNPNAATVGIFYADTAVYAHKGKGAPPRRAPLLPFQSSSCLDI
jgi:hypothetical protein